jgi:hypothetical protein
VDEHYFFTTERGNVDPSEIRAFRVALGRQIREKLAGAPQTLDDFIFINKLDMEIKDEIGYNELKSEYARGEITIEEIRERYNKAFYNRDTGEYVRRFFGGSADSASGVSLVGETAPMGNGYRVGTEDTAVPGTGAHHDQLKQNRKGDIMVQLAPLGEWGHAAIWAEREGGNGDPDPYNAKHLNSISAWKYRQEYKNGKLYEWGTNDGVTYEYRQTWAALLDSPIYGLRVQGYVYVGGNLIWQDIPDSTAESAFLYAKSKADADPHVPYCYPITECNQNITWGFYCSSLGWRSWYQQGINVDSSWWIDQVSPKDIYWDGNTREMYHY